MATAPFPFPRRVVESNQATPLPRDGTVTEPGVDVHVQELEPVSEFGGILARARIATHNTVPAVIGAGPCIEVIDVAGVVHPGGAHIYYLDLAPRAETPMHRTESVDYVVVLKGTLTVVTPQRPFSVADSKGDFEPTETVVREGDVVVQRGAMHRLANRTDEWVRTIVIVLSAKPAEASVGAGETKQLTEAWLQ